MNFAISQIVSDGPNENFLVYTLANFTTISGFPKWGRLVGGGQFGQNGQKVHENDKIDIFGSKQWGEHRGGDKPIFRVVGGGSNCISI